MKLGPRVSEAEILDDQELWVEAYIEYSKSSAAEYRCRIRSTAHLIRTAQRRRRLTVGAKEWLAHMMRMQKWRRFRVAELQDARRLLETIDDE